MILIISAILFVALRIVLRHRSINLQQFFLIYLSACFGLSLVYLGSTGRLHWLFALLGGLVPFLSVAARNIVRIVQTVSLFRRFKGQFASSTGPVHSGQSSKLQTTFFEMILDHDSGDLNGKILVGKFSGQQLSQLQLADLLALLDECQTDQDSTNVLIAYLDRDYPDWQEQASAEHNTAATDTELLDERQALAILGLESDATRQDIINAHRRLIQKVHPDRGGSTYLAARINEAKSFLLKARGSE